MGQYTSILFGKAHGFNSQGSLGFATKFVHFNCTRLKKQLFQFNQKFKHMFYHGFFHIFAPHSTYPLVNCHVAIGNGHRKFVDLPIQKGDSHWFSICYQRVFSSVHPSCDGTPSSGKACLPRFFRCPRAVSRFALASTGMRETRSWTRASKGSDTLQKGKWSKPPPTTQAETPT